VGELDLRRRRRDAVASAIDRFGERGGSAKRQFYGTLTAGVWFGGSEVAVPWVTP
jgi:hypothetical protein